jgi:hypothetical protein
VPSGRGCAARPVRSCVPVMGRQTTHDYARFGMGQGVCTVPRTAPALDAEQEPVPPLRPHPQCAISGSARLAPLLSTHGRGAGSHDHQEHRPFSTIWRCRPCSWRFRALEARRRARHGYSRSPAASREFATTALRDQPLRVCRVGAAAHPALAEAPSTRRRRNRSIAASNAVAVRLFSI